MDAERRRQTRRRVMLRGRIVLPGGGSAFDCMVADMSDDGARLRTSGLQPLPERFRLGVDRAELRAVEVRYRTLDATGVRFLDRFV